MRVICSAVGGRRFDTSESYQVRERAAGNTPSALVEHGLTRSGAEQLVPIARGNGEHDHGTPGTEELDLSSIVGSLEPPPLVGRD
ncbi:MAG: hypothetical protein AAGF73_11985 [Actinomycetota bacterium]